MHDRTVDQTWRRQGFTTMEIVVALGLLSIAAVLLSQIGVAQLGERRRQSSRQEALETAANILESARILPPQELNERWAASQQLPKALAERLLDGKLKVSVDPYAAQPSVKKVKVEISWSHQAHQPSGPVVLSGFFGTRAASLSEEKP